MEIIFEMAMEIIFEMAMEIFGFLTRIFLYFFVEILFEFFFKYVFFNLGYYTLKIVTLSNFPKDREKAEKIHTEIAVFGIFVFIISIVIFFKQIL